MYLCSNVFESVIIGGLIENKNEIVEEKVPVLGDIPVLGELFKNESNLNRKNNLVIIVTMIAKEVMLWSNMYYT